MMDKRFQGKTGEEFDLSAIAISHRQEMQELIGSVIHDEFKDKDVKLIKVLEIGFGTGFTTKIIAKSDNRIKVFAIDNEVKMLEQAESNLAPLIQNDKIKLIHEGALEFLEKQDTDSYDVFASSETMHNFEHEYRQKILKEIYRVLKTDGLFINADKYALDNENKHKENFAKLLKVLKEKFERAKSCCFSSCKFCETNYSNFSKESLNWQLQEFQTKLAPLGRQDLIKEWTQHYLDDNKPERIMKESKSIELLKSLGFKDKHNF